ncbi:uncharacterized protein LOC126678502 [Mercurialis annua]|uniref:uncharacterized protein LOC126678502 n=1 Tax=Mercurialis annua TaxID=3986 RepID=UPI00215DD949|nr:uncharacterized protein LOC126678502 [Mercurialis annua]
MDLPALCQSLSLSDEEDVVVCDLGAAAREVGEKKIATSLFGKVLSTKRVSRDGFISTIKYVWKTKDPLVIETVGSNLFIFHFGSEADRRRVLMGGPWNYQEYLLVLEAPTGIGDITEAKFNLVPFWIQIHQLPLMCLNKEAGLSLGKQIGEVEEVDHGASGDCLGKYIRVRVKVDVTKPLKRGLKVRVDSAGSIITAVLRYERLPELCYRCGTLGHPILECPINADGGQCKFNDLIRAGPTILESRGKRFRSSVEKHPERGGGRRAAPSLGRLTESTIKSAKLVSESNMGGNPAISNLIKEIEGDKVSKIEVGKYGIDVGKNIENADLIEIEIDKVTEKKGKKILALSNVLSQNTEREKMGLFTKAKFNKKGPKKASSTLSPKKKIGKGSKKKMVALEDFTFLSPKIVGESSGNKEGGNQRFLALRQTEDDGGDFVINELAAVPAQQDCRDQ